ncbi:ParB/RepB/Spo0J family partition protein [Zavarzinia compransoris]|uniref:ParB/RepB/Spo0J family partition protein n=1 Tax=Zavarzinia marina TaxID=2911065 RepID=UPI001F4452A4|nr:ParB/RepB/Spo0J family partition protein [Zavarzinia marina]MCF4166821.1 ParB/RepB/Spo0J family partition protein [Zavarzinia marina]
MADDSRKKGLGRGLSALMGEVREAVTPPPGAAPGEKPRGLRELPIEQLQANPNQPRKRFTPEALEDLVASIKSHGILQPILVRRLGPERYEIIAGERRWRAAQSARLHQVPVVVKDFTDVEVMEVALVENIQRADLTAIEEALGYQRLIEDFGHTQDAIAQIVGKSRSHIANMLRLLSLPAAVKDLVDRGDLSAGHARALIGLADAPALAQRAVEQGLTVRQMEDLAKKAKNPNAAPSGGQGGGAKDADTMELEGNLSAAIGLPVAIAHKGDAGGSITIRYHTLDELDRICGKLSRVED